ncbi:uncharacterized protein LOC117333943 [Pecten maximus]|uniref:uncharacterized protein LOC117333943 n=1 Tax=Pecten maximus TaxID=6579 RepID=UPI001457E67B|nr:uncharacterized protein LOC117333943 [Pecten maximus]
MFLMVAKGLAMDDCVEGNQVVWGRDDCVESNQVVWGRDDCVEGNEVVWGRDDCVESNQVEWGRDDCVEGNQVEWGRDDCVESNQVEWGRDDCVESNQVEWGRNGCVEGNQVEWGRDDCVEGQSGYISSTQSPFFFSSVKGDWSSCKTYCENQSGRLVVIDTQDKYDHVLDMDQQYHSNIISSSQLFIGLYTRTKDCTNYTWVSGSMMTWSKWDLAIREPNSCNWDLCIRLYDGLFRTTECTNEYVALCEYVFPESTSSMTSSSTSMTTGKMISSAKATTVIPESSPAMATRNTISSAKATTAIPESWTSVASSSASIDTRPVVSSTAETAATKTSVRGTTAVRQNTTPDPTTGSSTTYDPCRRKKTNVTQLSQADLLEALVLLKVELTVMKNSTSIARRKKISVYESRSSCLALGSMAAAIISFAIGWIVVPDVIRMYVHLSSNANKQNTVNP